MPDGGELLWEDWVPAAKVLIRVWMPLALMLAAGASGGGLSHSLQLTLTLTLTSTTTEMKGFMPGEGCDEY